MRGAETERRRRKKSSWLDRTRTGLALDALRCDAMRCGCGCDARLRKFILSRPVLSSGQVSLTALLQGFLHGTGRFERRPWHGGLPIPISPPFNSSHSAFDLI
ncbi:hypothetical protein M431DRAFT_436423 [Trichoderma harzianum CBS 226.95]|uniref:Uncharacterized protein n=1 Tax=Trichoderma harzianum CBS 226.95 TaxID=983964 RepID=A0A2T4ADE7_TRIHA|nr:hypothetical protein M431DRAFT_436423 [Trichoderma harzianum CBS 226.95]PTB55033.1 hypothetical protein M431DRAFT_436423 [Trichoderma harzianum CBS 226.95]